LAKVPKFDRRKYPRVRTDAVAAIERVDSPNVVAYAVDLSLGGIRFQYLGTGLEFEIGELVQMTVNLGDSDVSAAGEIMRIEDLDTSAHELAVAFAELDARTLELLQDYLGDGQGQES
jgi:hypothetical protein